MICMGELIIIFICVLGLTWPLVCLYVCWGGEGAYMAIRMLVCVFWGGAYVAIRMLVCVLGAYLAIRMDMF